MPLLVIIKIDVVKFDFGAIKILKATLSFFMLHVRYG